MAKYLDNDGLLYFWTKLKALFGTKVDKVTGKGLSTNDYTSAEKTKLGGIATGAQVNTITGVKGDSESTYRTGQVSIGKDDVGLNNVTNDAQVKGLSTGTTENNVVVFGADGYTVKDSGKTLGKSVPADAKFTDHEYDEATTSAAGLMSASDKSKLNGVAAGANNYSLPTATPSVLGGVKVGSGLGVSSGVVSVSSAPKLGTARTISLTGDASGSASFDGSANVSIPVTVADDSHNHTIANVDGLQGELDAKLSSTTAAATYAKKTDIVNVYKYKGSVATVADLPASGNTAGDVYNVEARGVNYAWTGEAWDSLGELFEIQTITNSEIDTICAS